MMAERGTMPVAVTSVTQLFSQPRIWSLRNATAPAAHDRKGADHTEFSAERERLDRSAACGFA